MVYLKVKKLKEEAVILSKREEDAGYDIYGLLENDFLILKSGEIKLFSTGLALEIPKEWVFYIAERGSTGSKGISKRAGVIDSGYRGEVFIAINNTSNKVIVFHKKNGEELNNFLEENSLDMNSITLYPMSKAIAQGFLINVPHVDIEIVNELSTSKRGEGMLGSSGK